MTDNSCLFKIWPPESEGSAFSLAVYFDEKPGSNPFSIQRVTGKASIYSGALLDNKSNIHQHVDIHVQHRSFPSDSASPSLHTESDSQIDKEWHQFREALQQTEDSIIFLGIENNPFPSVETETGDVFNKEESHIFITKSAPISLRNWKNLLEEQTFQENGLNDSSFKENTIYKRLFSSKETSFHEDLFLQVQNHSKAHSLEAFHLKLSYLLDIFTMLQRYTELLQKPFLNISPDHFGISIVNNTRGLPLFWSGQTHLLNAGECHRLTDPPLLIAAIDFEPSLYRMPIEMSPREGSGTLHSNNIEKTENGSLSRIHGILSSENLHKAPPGARVLITLHSPHGDHTISAYIEEQLDDDRCSFVSEASSYPEWLSSKEEGFSSPCRFSIFPVLSSACDLYSLGILTLFLLHDTKAQPISAALESIKHMAKSLPDRFSDKDITNYFEKQNGNQSILRDLLVPDNLLAETMAFVTNLLTGIHPSTYAKNVSDIPPDRQHSVYNSPITDLRKLVRKSRSLTLGDQQRNSEIRRLIDRAQEMRTG